MGLFDFLFGKKHAPDAKTQAGAEKRGAPAAKPPAAPGEPQIVYRVLTMNGVNTLIPMDTYSGLENAFLQHAQKTLNADKTFTRAHEQCVSIVSKRGGWAEGRFVKMIGFSRQARKGSVFQGAVL